MYLAIDVGGTKTLVASFGSSGTISENIVFPTPKVYKDFLVELESIVANLSVDKFARICVAIPGRVDRINGIGTVFGNLPWKNVPIQSDLEKLFSVPVIVENDAKLAGLSEAKLIISDYKRVLYITIGTGIGTGIIIDGVIDPSFADSEGGHIRLQHGDKVQEWEKFASGKAVFEKYGKKASEITDDKAWVSIARNIAVGLIDLLAVIQPEVVVIGGGLGSHLSKYKKQLAKELKKYENPMVPIPPILQAKRPEEAVVYGCYDLIKAFYADNPK